MGLCILSEVHVAVFLDKHIYPPDLVLQAFGLAVSCPMCAIESKLSAVHICHDTKSRFAPLANRHLAINIKNI